MFIAPMKNYTLQQKHGFSFLLQPLSLSNIIQRQVTSGYSKPNGTALMTNIPWQEGVMKKDSLKGLWDRGVEFQILYPTNTLRGLNFN